MIAKISSATPEGLSGHIIEIEGDANRGLPSFNIVGMAAKTVNEAKDRVRSAIINSGFIFPTTKVTINLAPADLQKTGTQFDLPIALAILRLSKQLSEADTADTLFVGELSLNGDIKPVKSIISLVETAKKAHYHTVFVPYKNFAQAKLIPNINILPAKNLQEVFLHLKSIQQIIPPKIVVKNTETEENDLVYDQIRGQEDAKRAITIAIAGHHNLLFYGPPGSGKTMLAKAAADLLPPLCFEDQLTLTKLYSISSANPKITPHPPFRHPHHTSSIISIIGGGVHSYPGEISLSHRGILFLDEIPEFPRSTLEALRQPLEDKTITISRANSKVTYPADFILIATMNPCPCGYLNDPNHECTCSPQQILHYRKKLSGPLLDRIDMIVNVMPTDPNQIFSSFTQQNRPNSLHKSFNKTLNFSTGSVVKNTITEVKSLQSRRFNSQTTFNGTLSTKQLQTYINLTQPAKSFLNQSTTSLKLSTRSYLKIIKISQTIADLAKSPHITPEHIAEAIHYHSPPDFHKF